MKTINNITIILFTILGLSALISVIFFGAYHQIITVGICALMVLVSVSDNRRENIRNKSKAS